MGQNQVLRYFDCRDPGVKVIEPDPDHGVLHRQDAPAKAVVVPESALQGPVDVHRHLKLSHPCPDTTGLLNKATRKTENGRIRKGHFR